MTWTWRGLGKQQADGRAVGARMHRKPPRPPHTRPSPPELGMPLAWGVEAA